MTSRSLIVDPDVDGRRIWGVVGGDDSMAEWMTEQLVLATGRNAGSLQSISSDKFDPSLCNADSDLVSLTQNLERDRTRRRLASGDGWNMLLSGPPGTGKSAYTAHLAETIGLDLIVLQGADLLSAYIGETEKSIAQAFVSAREKPVLLLIDEVDGFLGDRRTMQPSWEITQINALLTAMEVEQARFVAATNLHDRLDPASARRFSLHVRFGSLARDQAAKLFVQMFEQPAPPSLHVFRREGALMRFGQVGYDHRRLSRKCCNIVIPRYFVCCKLQHLLHNFDIM